MRLHEQNRPSAIHLVPYPEPIDSTKPLDEVHYKPFSELYGKPTTEIFCPSLMCITEAKSSPSAIIKASNGRATVQCVTCDRHRIIYSEKGLNKDFKRDFAKFEEAYHYSCGDPLFADEEQSVYYKKVIVDTALKCTSPVETELFLLARHTSTDHKVWATNLVKDMCSCCGRIDGELDHDFDTIIPVF